MRLDVRLLYLRHNVVGLKDSICLGEALLDVADIDPDFGGQVAGRV